MPLLVCGNKLPVTIANSSDNVAELLVAILDLAH